ncbi:citryl-CoA lyase [Salinicola acroporae]|uniref:citrate synthase (unknown stereospecificity) n=1 Tax=Salinicola acroporae TaxID=1541440 RepID=A0ABT6I601_9GAMM|nr:citryl-CoA lyase [Salinicola acroporae]MDH4572849.1 citryl-CoA lyase [Salinicola acroporae]
MSQHDTSHDDEKAVSNISRVTHDSVHIHGIDLIAMLGNVNLGDFAFLELFKRLPEERESIVFNALVVALVEHGLMPSAIATRMTYLGAPESIQGAVSAGLLGLGNTFVGTMEGSARLCQEFMAEGAGPETDIEAAAEHIITHYREQKKVIPGIGHPVHKPRDPRADKLMAIAVEQGFDDTPIRLMQAISEQASRRFDKTLPVNVTGAIGAIATSMNIDWKITRGLGVMARAIGLVGHILEETRTPTAQKIWNRAERECNEDTDPSN